jgi:hydroxymethylpyrimidine/phosphomethylpyrimidine kinase
MATVATVGTSHPLAFAGLGLTLQALMAGGDRPVFVVAGVSAQTSARVLARRSVDVETIVAQFAALADADVRAVHVGALLSAEAVAAVARGLDTLPGVPVVLDPVLATTGGDPLGGAAVAAALREHLLPRAALVTPNLDEAGALLGTAVRDVPAMAAAARALIACGTGAALVKGGHLAGDTVDVLADDAGVHEFSAARLAGELRGTGDLLAVSIAAALANGDTMRAAITHARQRVRDAIAHGEMFAGTRVAAWRTQARDHDADDFR